MAVVRNRQHSIKLACTCPKIFLEHSLVDWYFEKLKDIFSKKPTPVILVLQQFSYPVYINLTLNRVIL